MLLNNKGWGMPQLIIGIAIIIGFLLTAAFVSLRLNNWLETNGKLSSTSTTNNATNKVVDNTTKSYYVSKSNEIINATNKYIETENISLDKNSTIQIQLDLLINQNYLESINDYYTDNACQGYSVTYLDSSNIKEIKAYLKCDNYATEGYAE